MSTGIDAPDTTHLPPVTAIQPGPAAWSTGSAGNIAAANSTMQPPQTRLLSGAGKWLPVAYGSNRYAGLLYFGRVRADTGAMVLGVAGGEGEIDAVTAVEINNEPLRAGCSWTAYRGLATQAVDPTITAALAASVPAGVYADALHGIFHVVVSLAATAYTATELHGVDITFRGKRIFDPRDGTQSATDPTTWKYSTNAALIRADYLSSGNALARGVRPRYGRGMRCDYTASIAAFDWCDTLAGVYPAQIKRGEFHGAFIDPQRDSVNDELLKTASMAWVRIEGETFTLVPDKPRSSVYTFDDDPTAADNIFKWERIFERRADSVPTVIEGSFTDKTTKPWGTRPYRVVHPYVLTGQLPEVTENVDMRFAQSIGAASRFGLQRLNMKQLNSRAWGITGAPETLVLGFGDVVTTTHKIGLSAKLWVVDAAMDRGGGDVHLKLSEFDPAMYANVIVTEPTTTGDGSLNCDTYPAISALTATELAQWEPDPEAESGYACTKRVQVVWTVGYYPCLAYYEAELSQGGTVIETGPSASAAWVSNPVAAGTYTLRVRQVSSVPGMAPSAWTSTSVTISATACAPSAPRDVYIVGVRDYQEYSTPPYIDAETRTIHVGAPLSPTTHTEVWFGNASDTFATATLRGTLTGAPSSIMYAAYTAVGGSGYEWFDEFDGTATSHGNIAFNPRPLMPEKVWLRYRNGGAASPATLVICSAPRLSQAAMQINNVGVGYADGHLRTLDGTFFVPVGGDSHSYTAASGGAPLTMTAYAGTLTYSYLGGSNHLVAAELFDGYGESVSGSALFGAMRLY